MSKLHTTIERVIRYRYIIVIGIFVILQGFVSDTSFWNIYQHHREINELRVEMEKYKLSYEESTRVLEQLQSNHEEVERVAREQHHMKRDGEDVFLLIDVNK